MEVKLRLWWQQINRQRVAIRVVAIVLIVTIALVFAVLLFGWDWTGFNGGYSQITTTITSHGTSTTTVKPPGKNLWDWFQLLGVLAIPVVVGFGAVRYTRIQQLRDQENERLQHKREQEAAKIQHDRDQQLADQRAESERRDAAERARLEHEITLDNQREAALQAYIDKISELLLIENLGELKPEYAGVRKIARVRTLTLLLRLDGKRNGSVLQFLQEAGLIHANENIIHLGGADLSHAYLRNAVLLSANLSGADLSQALLRNANLQYADLRGAKLMNEEDVNEGDVTENANLKSANLSGANLEGAKITQEQLNQARSLKGATMPDGSKHP